MNQSNLQKRKPIRSKRITQAAKGESCCVCGANDGTTVFCHLNESWAGKGMGQKADDIAGFFGCHDCHRKYDSMGGTGITELRAMYKTWRILWDKGIIGELK